MSEELLYDRREGIGFVTFHRPGALNSLTFAMYEWLAEICERAPDKGDARALVLRGAGNKAFAAGTDIAQFRSFKTAEDALGYEQRIDKVLGAVERCPLPTVAALPGASTGTRRSVVSGMGGAVGCHIGGRLNY